MFHTVEGPCPITEDIKRKGWSTLKRRLLRAQKEVAFGLRLRHHFPLVSACQPSEFRPASLHSHMSQLLKNLPILVSLCLFLFPSFPPSLSLPLSLHIYLNTADSSQESTSYTLHPVPQLPSSLVP